VLPDNCDLLKKGAEMTHNRTLAIFDAHIHTEFSGAPDPLSGITATLERYLADRKRAGVVGALTDSASPCQQVEDLMMHGIHRCAVIGSSEFTPESIEVDLNRGLCRAIKINLGFIHKYASDSCFLPIYELAARYNIPLLFHTGDPGWAKAKIKYAHPITLDEVIVDYPSVNFVLVHAGNPWFETAAVITDKNPNAFLELSGLLNGNVATLPPRTTQAHMIEPITRLVTYLGGASKLIFGSGWPMVDLPAYIAAVQQALPEEHWEDVFHGNAARLFRI